MTAFSTTAAEQGRRCSRRRSSKEQAILQALARAGFEVRSKGRWQRFICKAGEARQ